MKGQASLFFGLFILFFVLAIAAVFTSAFVAALPASEAKTFVTNLTHYSFGFVDTSIIVFLFLALFLDLLASFMKPTIGKAILNLFFILFLAFINIALRTGLNPIATSLSTNTLLPNTTTLLTASFAGGTPILSFIFYFFLVFSIIFNVR